MTSLTSTVWMESFRRSRRVQPVQKVHGRDAPAVVIVIAIAGGAVADAVQEAVREVTAVATPVAVGAEEGEIALSRARLYGMRGGTRARIRVCL